MKMSGTAVVAANPAVSSSMCPQCYSTQVTLSTWRRTEHPELNGRPFQICSRCKFKTWIENVYGMLNGDPDLNRLSEQCFWCGKTLFVKAASASIKRPYFACPADGFDRFVEFEPASNPSISTCTLGEDISMRDETSPDSCNPVSITRNVSLIRSDTIASEQMDTSQPYGESWHDWQNVIIDCAAGEDGTGLRGGEEEYGLEAPETEHCLSSSSLSGTHASNDENLANMVLCNGQRPSAKQLAVFDFIRGAQGRHAVIEAVAGSGKTGTLVKLWEMVPSDRKCIYLAYNKSVQMHLATYLRKAPSSRVDNQTIHSCALHALRTALAARKRKLKVAMHDSGKNDMKYRGIEAGLPNSVKNLLIRAKEMCQYSLADGSEQIHSVLVKFGIVHDLTELNQSRTHISIDEFEREVLTLMNYTKSEFLRRTKAEFLCSFEDLIWLPCVLPEHITLPQYDFVFVDETQDLNKSQLALVKRLVERLPTGRIIAVGDPRQAIYAFRGADLQAMDNMRKDLNATVLGLTVSFRCPKKVVLLAQSIAPEIEAAPNAMEGNIRQISPSELIEEVAPGDFVLSRSNAPLAPICLALARKGIPVVIRGRRDVKTRMKGMVETGRKSPEIPFVEMLETICMKVWLDSEEGKTSPAHADMIEDCAMTLKHFYLADPVAGLDGVSAMIGRFFLEAEEVVEDSKTVILSTVHQAKGLERKRVFVLRQTFLDGQRVTEEDNIWYVAITRAKEELIIVGSARISPQKAELFVKAAQLMCKVSDLPKQHPIVGTSSSSSAQIGGLKREPAGSTTFEVKREGVLHQL